MASWLKVAEDLFEVVDRRAKLVVSELGDEQPNLKSQATSDGQEIQTWKNIPNAKIQSRRSTVESLKSTVTLGESTNSVSSHDGPSKSPAEILVTAEQKTADKTEKEEEEADIFPRVDASENKAHDFDDLKAATSFNNDVKVASSVDNLSGISDGPKEVSDTTRASSVSSDPNHVNVPRKDEMIYDEDNLKLAQENLKVNKEKEESVWSRKDRDDVAELVGTSEITKNHDQKSDRMPENLLEQLDEANILMKSAVSSGQSKEARLARVCAGLSSRLQEYKAENAQLEELLMKERGRSSSYEASIQQLEQELLTSRMEMTKVESSMSDALSAKNAEIEKVVGSIDAFKKQATAAEEKLASLQANMDAMMRGRELTETRVIQALREELAAAERRAEEERIAHSTTKMAAVEREVELEHRAVEASNALARMQRSADESISKAMELEHKVALLEVECGSLNQELQDMEAKMRRGLKKTSEEANQILQIQAWQEEVERAREAQRNAESKLSLLEAEMQKMRVEMAGMRRDAEHYSRQEHMELEKRYRELTDLLYQKQTQLEAMASERSAVQYQLEKEAGRLREVQIEAERSRVSRRGLSSWEEENDLKTLDSLPLHHRHLVGAGIQLQRAVKFLDSGAVRATRFLWRYPVARVLLLLYLVFVHLFLMYLLHSLQEQVDGSAEMDFSTSLRLNNSSLP